ncbi:MAG: oligopeptide/dipeptide ABC transporter ATP-binding protein [Pseudomonadota bacterium]
MSQQDTLLKVEGLKVHYPLPKSGWFQPASVVHAVDGVDFSIPRGSTFGVVGESGSGKTTAALAVMRLAPISAGTISLDGEDLGRAEGKDLRALRSKVQIIFQDPYSSLNPRMRAGAIVREAMDLMNVGDPSERDDAVVELFEKVGLRAEQTALFPHQFSGGQRQRIGVARALASRPDLVVCDEPVSALDVAIQAQILNLLGRLQEEFGLTYLFISHDLGVVQHICDEIAVMYLGQFVEQADRRSLFQRPRHPYTWALISAVPSADLKHDRQNRRVKLEGDPPSPIDLPSGCRFSGRCPFAQEQCHQHVPEFREVGEGHMAACHLIDENGVPPHERL